MKKKDVVFGSFSYHEDIYCPNCNTHHVDKDEWAKRLHKKHLCEECGNIWQPHNGYTFGIKATENIQNQ